MAKDQILMHYVLFLLLHAVATESWKKVRSLPFIRAHACQTEQTGRCKRVLDALVHQEASISYIDEQRKQTSWSGVGDALAGARAVLLEYRGALRRGAAKLDVRQARKSAHRA
eukprot:3807494-Pleurochrysis_carterae.AAC.4